MSSSIRDIFRRRRPMDERLPDGTSVEDLLRVTQSSADVNSGQGGGPLNVPVASVPATRPRRTYNTTLSPEEETQFAEWKQQNAPNDSGADYDLRGAFKAGVTPDARTKHWSDRFKKPNHPTFSNESQYAIGADAARAGTWNGDQFVPARSVMDGVKQAVARPVVQQPQQQVARPDDLSSAIRDRRTEPRDFIADDEAALRQLENQPISFWKRFGAGLLSRVITPRGQELIPITRRQRDIQRLRGQLGRDIKVAGERARIEQGEMVPFQLPDGSWTVAPARTVGGIQSRQQTQSENRSIRLKQLDEYKARHAQMAKHEARADAQRLFNSGAADDNDDLKDEIIREMGLPPTTRLPNHDKGQLATDAEGNFQVINTRSGVAKPAMQSTETGPRKVGSFAKTQMEATNTRAANAQAGANQRAANAQAGADRRAGMRGQGGATTDKTALRRAAQLAGEVEKVRKELEAYDASTPAEKRDELYRKEIANKAAAAVTELNNLGAGYKASVEGRGGYPYAERIDGQSAPANDGKHHYSMSQIQSTIDPKTGLTKNGKRLEQVLNELKSHPNVVIDQ